MKYVLTYTVLFVLLFLAGCGAQPAAVPTPTTAPPAADSTDTDSDPTADEDAAPDEPTADEDAAPDEPTADEHTTDEDATPDDPTTDDPTTDEDTTPDDPTADEDTTPDTAVTDSTEISVEPGPYLYVNGNEVFDHVLYNGQIWAATLGGVVVWDAASGEHTAWYTTLDGLPTVGVFSIDACDLDTPLIVIGTANGLGFYDPATETWSLSSVNADDSELTQALDIMGARSEVRFVQCDEENNRVFFDQDGLSTYDLATGEMQPYVSSDNLAWSAIEDIAMAGETMWIASGYKGVTQTDGAETTVYNIETGNLPADRVYGIGTTSDGTVWMAGDEGLVKLSNGEATLYTHEQVADFPEYGGLDHLAITPDDRIWLGASGFLCQFDPANESCATLYTSEDGVVSGSMSALTVDEQGHIYYSLHSDGLVQFGGTTWNHLLLEDTVPRISVYYSIAEHNGEIWAGSDGTGIARTDLDVSEWEIISSSSDENGPSSGTTRDMLSLEDGIWLLHGRSMSFFDGSEWTNLTTDDGFFDSSANAITVDDQGRIWIGGDGFISIWDGSTFTNIEAGTSGLPADVNVRNLLADGSVMWVATTGGLVRFENDTGELVVDETTEGLPDDNIGGLAKEADGTYILGTASGLARYQDNTVTPFEQSPESIYNVQVDADGGIWLNSLAGGDQSGLYYFDGSTWYQLNSMHGLPVSDVRGFTIDSAGTLWAVGGNTKRGGGIFRLVPDDEPIAQAVQTIAFSTGSEEATAPEEETPEEETPADEPTEASEPASEEPTTDTDEGTGDEADTGNTGDEADTGNTGDEGSMDFGDVEQVTEDTFPLPDDVQNLRVQPSTIGGSVMFETALPAAEINTFYRDTFTADGATVREGISSLNGDILSLFFDGWSQASGKVVYVQTIPGAAEEGVLTVSLQFRDDL
jgi:ligand-binding sensor domain-containing protein